MVKTYNHNAMKYFVRFKPTEGRIKVPEYMFKEYADTYKPISNPDIVQRYLCKLVDGEHIVLGPISPWIIWNANKWEGELTDIQLVWSGIDSEGKDTATSGKNLGVESIEGTRIIWFELRNQSNKSFE